MVRLFSLSAEYKNAPGSGTLFPRTSSSPGNMGKSTDGQTVIRRHREQAVALPNVANGGLPLSRQTHHSPSPDDIPFSEEIQSPAHDSLGGEPSLAQVISSTSNTNTTSDSAQSPGTSGEGSTNQGEEDPDERPSESSNPEPPPRRLAASLSGRQLLNQRLQKYKLPAVFHANVVGPGQDQRWKGSFWIKGTFIGSSKLERTKWAAKEGAAMSALKWLNSNHYY